jgi:uncharacterized protein YcnI
MMPRLTSQLILAIAAITCVSIASAHVTVWPRTSIAGAHEKYTVRVPTEGAVATTSIELSIPNSVTFVSIGAGTEYTYELKKSEGRVVGIVWSMKIKPGEFAEFAFMVRNPKDAKDILWKATQRFADGSSTQWIGLAGEKQPASITTLSAAEDGHVH